MSSFIFSCTSPNSRSEKISSDNLNNDDSLVTSDEAGSIDKVVFLIENSGSMLGYVKDPTEFISTLVSLSYYPAFDNSKKHFYFVNGTDQIGKNSKISVNFIGEDPEILKTNLNQQNFSKYGDPRFSDLARIFEIALDSTKENQCTIVISDCIYDVGEDRNPLLSLKSETEKTEKLFRDRLKAENIETIIIKASSKFNGDYFYASEKRMSKINQKRPYFILIFGNSNQLNNFFSEKSISTEINNYEAIARYHLVNNSEFPYEIAPSEKRKGSFKPDHKLNNKIYDAKPLKGEFQFSIAVDYSQIAFLTDAYLTDTSNYYCPNSKFKITQIEKITKKIPGITGTHLLTLYTDKNPIGNVEIALKNNIPGWINNSDTDNERNIDETHTYGFKPLTEAISNAYEFKNNGQNIATFNLVISK